MQCAPLDLLDRARRWLKMAGPLKFMESASHMSHLFPTVVPRRLDHLCGLLQRSHSNFDIVDFDRIPGMIQNAIRRTYPSRCWRISLPH
jgi:hypothetical protein